jgi:hypothetical protein
LNKLTAGTYQLAVKVDVLIADVVVESILPNTVEVVILPAEPSAVTPTP